MSKATKTSLDEAEAIRQRSLQRGGSLGVLKDEIATALDAAYASGENARARKVAELVERLSKAELDAKVAHARGRDEAKAEDAQLIEDRAKACEANGQKYPQFASEWYGVANQIRQLRGPSSPLHPARR